MAKLTSKKKYPPELIKEAIKLRSDGHSYKSISHELGPAVVTIGGWVRKEAAQVLKRAKRLRTNIRYISHYK